MRRTAAHRAALADPEKKEISKRCAGNIAQEQRRREKLRVAQAAAPRTARQSARRAVAAFRGRSSPSSAAAPPCCSSYGLGARPRSVRIGALCGGYPYGIEEQIFEQEIVGCGSGARIASLQLADLAPCSSLSRTEQLICEMTTPNEKGSICLPPSLVYLPKYVTMFSLSAKADKLSN